MFPAAYYRREQQNKAETAKRALEDASPRVPAPPHRVLFEEGEWGDFQTLIDRSDNTVYVMDRERLREWYQSGVLSPQFRREVNRQLEMPFLQQEPSDQDRVWVADQLRRNASEAWPIVGQPHRNRNDDRPWYYDTIINGVSLGLVALGCLALFDKSRVKS